jgi:hypothetical protein
MVVDLHRLHAQGKASDLELSRRRIVVADLRPPPAAFDDALTGEWSLNCAISQYSRLPWEARFQNETLISGCNSWLFTTGGSVDVGPAIEERPYNRVTRSWVWA